MTPPASKWASVVFAGVLLSAAALGVAGDRLWLARRGLLIPPGLPPLGSMQRPSAETQRRITRELETALDITPAQTPVLERAIAAQITAMEALRDDVRPRLDSIFEQSRLTIDSVLTPAQKSRRDSLLAKLAPFTDSIGLRRPARTR